ncbi:MAG: hypothetical protein OXE77_03575 [Flavobacteriaceae bacterium]|nr:hypothetical protein [Flavobacteriaceae bacterium]
MYEFRNQVGLTATGGQTMIITAIRAFEGNPYGNHMNPSSVWLPKNWWLIDADAENVRWARPRDRF